MRAEKKELREREYRTASRRIDEIHRALAALPSCPLPRKLFVGHWRYLVVRADVLRSSVGKQVQAVVDRCNHWVLGKKNNPASYRCSTEVPVSAAETGFVSGQGLRPLTAEQWQEASFPDFFEHKWFRKVERTIRAGTKNIAVYRYFPEVPKHMLEFGYKPAYMTEAQVVDGDLESELKRLYSFMRNSHGWERVSGRHADEWDMSLRRAKVRLAEAAREVRAWSVTEA